MKLPIPAAVASRLEERSNQHVGLLAEFPNPGALYDAVKDLRERGYTRLDTFSPFPIHGMDRAMGLPVSKLGYLVFIGGITGAFLGWLLQYWTSEVDYAINISNKPLFAFESSVPDHLRADDPVLGADRHRRHARAQRAAPPLRPAVPLGPL